MFAILSASAMRAVAILPPNNVTLANAWSAVHCANVGVTKVAVPLLIAHAIFKVLVLCAFAVVAV